jgi:hypothetical protein
MYTFSTLAQNQHILTTRITTSANSKAYSVRNTRAGRVTVFVINKDLKASGKVVITPSARMGEASLLTVQAPSLDSKLVRFGGVSFDNSTGLLAGSPQSSLIAADTDGSYTVELSNSSIAVLTINP